MKESFSVITILYNHGGVLGYLLIKCVIFYSVYFLKHFNDSVSRFLHFKLKLDDFFYNIGAELYASIFHNNIFYYC